MANSGNWELVRAVPVGSLYAHVGMSLLLQDIATGTDLSVKRVAASMHLGQLYLLAIALSVTSSVYSHSMPTGHRKGDFIIITLIC